MVKKIQYAKVVSDRTVKIIITGKFQGRQSLTSGYYNVLYCNLNHFMIFF